MKEKIIIFGNGVQARLAYFYFQSDSNYEVVAFTVDAMYLKENLFLDKPIVSFEEAIKVYPVTEYKMFVAMGYKKMNQQRAKKYYEVKEKGYKLVSYISSKCTYLSQYPTGDNCLILEDNTIQPYVKIGNNVTLWSGNHIGHDVIIKDHCNITSHVVISGFTEIGEYSFIGVNATLRDDIKIAPFSLIGAGAIIMKDTKEKEVYVPERTKPFHKMSDELDF